MLNKWESLKNDSNPDDVYIGVTCSLKYSLDFEKYANNEETDDIVSLLLIVNSSGSDKKELLVFGSKDISKISSLPIKYYKLLKPQFSSIGLKEYLENWNKNLKSEGDRVKVVLFFQSNNEKLSFSNIQIVHCSDLELVGNLKKCFKYHYRRLQILKENIHQSKINNFLDNLDIMSAAWHNISSNFINNMFHPELNIKLDDGENAMSLKDWCIKHNIQLKEESNSKSLDDFILCDDDDTPSSGRSDENQTLTETEFDKVVSSPSGIEAYQAMTRLVSYLQGVKADAANIKSAKSLEDHLECGAILELNNFFTNRT